MSNGILALLAAGVWGLLIIVGTAVIRSTPGRWPWSKPMAQDDQAIPFNVDIGFGTDAQGQLVIGLSLQAGNATKNQEVHVPREASLILACKVLESQGEDGRRAAELLLKRSS